MKKKRRARFKPNELREDKIIVSMDRVRLIVICAVEAVWCGYRKKSMQIVRFRINFIIFKIQ